MHTWTGAGDLAGHPDRVRWNERHRARTPDFTPHPLVVAALAADPPPGPALELACGASGSALALAAAGRPVVAVDVSDVALAQLRDEARRRGLADRIDLVEADLTSYGPGSRRFALVLATRFWHPDAFESACRAVAPGGLLAWEALADDRSGWSVRHGELGTRLPPDFQVLSEQLISEQRQFTRLLARQRAARDPH